MLGITSERYSPSTNAHVGLEHVLKMKNYHVQNLSLKMDDTIKLLLLNMLNVRRAMLEGSYC